MRTRRLCFPMLATSLAVALFLMGDSVRAGGPPAASLTWPPITRITKPWTRWWWMGSAVNEKDLTIEMEKYAKAGLGGLEITPIYGVKGREDRFIQYLSPRWMDMLTHTLRQADRLDLGIDMATGNGWPFGGPWVGAEEACKNVVFKTYTLRAGERLEAPVRLEQAPMVRVIGRRVAISELKQPVGANEDLQALALEQVRFEKPLSLRALMAYSDQGAILPLMDRVAADGTLDWTAPAGSWTLFAVFQGWHGKMVERAGPGGEGDVIDHFSARALTRYLSRFDQAYAGRDVGALRSYFNDSYEVDDAVGESNWTDDFFEQFRARRGYDLRDHLPALFGDHSDEQGIRVLCDYRETISDLLLEEFTIPWNEWARSKGATTRNQAHGSPANILDLYAASGIPETEGEDVLRFQLASSAAHVAGRPLASSESATWLAEHFQASLADVKTALDRFFLGGINHVFYHGTSFSPPEEDWPGWLFYASVHFGPTNTFWRDSSALNQYVARCQSFLQNGKPNNDVLLYFPIHDRWSDPGRSLLQHFTGAPADTPARSTAEALLAAGHAFDFISGRQLANVNVVDGSLRTGGVSYATVVLPECRFIPLRAFERLAALAEAGATIVVHKRLPADVPGWSDLRVRQSLYRELMDRIRFEPAGESGLQTAAVGKGHFLMGDDLDRLLSYAGIQREPMADRGLRFVRRDLGDGHCYFVVNSGAETLDGWVRLRVGARSVAVFDPMRGSSGLAAIRASESGGSEVYLQLTPGESCILKTSGTKIHGRKHAYLQAKGQPREIVGQWTVRFIEGGPELPPATMTQALASWTSWDGDAVKSFSGTAKYMISFEKPRERADQWLLDLGVVRESARVVLNGRELGTRIGPPFSAPILGSQLQAKNMLEIEVSNLMANRIAELDRRGVAWKEFYNVNFPAKRRENRGADGLFTAAAWLPRESGLIGPVRLVPMQRKALATKR